MTIKFENLYKSYDDVEILHGISFVVEPGKPMAFLGRNGAGKTTTIRGFMDVFKFDSGEVLIDGKPFKVSDYKIGYLPEERGLYQKHKILDQLIYFSKLRGIDEKSAKKNILDLLEKVGLEKYANKKLETLSKGNQQKVQIVQALMNEPDLIILDEPFSGLDPVNSKILRDLVNDFSKAGKYLIFSSHQMGYVEEMCDDLTIIKDGSIVISDKIKSIKKEMGKGRIFLEAENMPGHELELYLKSQMPDFEYLKKDSGLIIDLQGSKKEDFLQNLLDIQVHIKTFGAYEPSVYDIFIALAGGGQDE
ncbi:ABC transporter ATP-binding protein [Neofamilia massiliensis]|uniref:ABC transporter ATP-binding protein n=1 Tax=Neofamilia massiliensis TaxID=1673724 RepID=UPI0006BB8288|nr:ATP-binding cassette domain-containing protein [Neofamilia massiliensis]